MIPPNNSAKKPAQCSAFFPLLSQGVTPVFVWIPLDEVNPDEFGLTSIRHAVIRFLAQRTP